MIERNYQKELYELIQRVEKAKIITKKELEETIPVMGVFNTRPADYYTLQDALIVAKLYLKRKGIEKFRLEDLPEPLRLAIVKYYARAINRNVNYFGERTRIWFWADLTLERKQLMEEVEKLTLEHVVLDWLRQTSVLIITITGYMGKGKTDFAFKIAEKMYRMGEVDYIISNTRIFDDAKEFAIFKKGYVKVNKVSELIMFLVKHRDKKKVLILDEAALHLMARRSSSNKNVLFIKLMVLFRKLGTHMIITIQDRELLDRVMRDFTGVLIEKTDKEEAIVYDSFRRDFYVLTDIKRTYVPFDTNYLAPLVLDVEEKLLDEILLKLDELTTSGAPDDIIIKEMSKILNGKRHVQRATDTEIRLIKYILEKKKVDYGTIHQELGISKGTASKYLPTWVKSKYLTKARDGGHYVFSLTPVGEEHFKKKLAEKA